MVASTETPPWTLSSELVQEISKLRAEMIRRGEAYDEQMKTLREENAAAFRKHSQDRYEADTRQFLLVMETRLVMLFSEHFEVTIRRCEACDESLTELREEIAALCKQQTESLSSRQAFLTQERYAEEKQQLLAIIESQRQEMDTRLSQECAKLQSIQAQLKHDYESKLAVTEQEKAVFRPQSEALLVEQPEVQKQSNAALQALLAQITQLLTQEEAKKAELLMTSFPPMAFGPKEWKNYFGEVGAAPPLPDNIYDVLKKPCPFWPGKRIKDTHLLVLVPATVDGRPFSLDLLGELVKYPQGGGSKTDYYRYDWEIEQEWGAQSHSSSYWVLMPRGVLPGSLNLTYDAQKALVAEHAQRLDVGYEMPCALAAATAILMHEVRSGERVESYPTRCQEKVSGSKTICVSWTLAGMSLRHLDDIAFSYVGVSPLRKF